MEKELRFQVETDAGVKPAVLFPLPDVHESHLRAIEFDCEIDVLVELDPGGYFGLILEAGHDFPVWGFVGEFEANGGIILIVLVLNRIGKILVAELVPKEDVLLELDQGFKFGVINCLSLGIEEVILKIALLVIARQKNLTPFILP